MFSTKRLWPSWRANFMRLWNSDRQTRIAIVCAGSGWASAASLMLVLELDKSFRYLSSRASVVLGCITMASWIVLAVGGFFVIRTKFRLIRQAKAAASAADRGVESRGKGEPLE